MMRHRNRSPKEVITLKSVAEHVGLSMGTILLVLNRAPQSSSIPRSVHRIVFLLRPASSTTDRTQSREHCGRSGQPCTRITRMRRTTVHALCCSQAPRSSREPCMPSGKPAFAYQPMFPSWGSDTALRCSACQHLATQVRAMRVDNPALLDLATSRSSYEVFRMSLEVPPAAGT